jgi:hypothetical protein
VLTKHLRIAAAQLGACCLHREFGVLLLGAVSQVFKTRCNMQQHCNLARKRTRCMVPDHEGVPQGSQWGFTVKLAAAASRELNSVSC